MALNPKQERFCEEYIVDLNATQAYIRAGYSPKRAHVNAALLMAKHSIAERIAELKASRSERTQVTADDVVRELAKLGFSDIRAIFSPSGTMLQCNEWPDDVAASISSVETDESPLGVVTRKVRRWDKKGSLELLGRHLGMWNDKRKIELTGEDGKPIQVEQKVDIFTRIEQFEEAFDSTA